ncbi:transposable element Tcb1 transposase [Trichonephila clavipes]|nr:transposable element Tcb1 transposase [Trichonephila clavipes]
MSSFAGRNMVNALHRLEHGKTWFQQIKSGDFNVKDRELWLPPSYNAELGPVYLAVTARRNRRSAASDLSRQLSSATGTTVSRQTVYRRLGHTDVYAHKPVRCVPLTATHCRLRLTWSREHALWTPQQWSCVMCSLRRVLV